MYRTRNQRRSAFTLIELLMVAAILAVLAAFAVPALMKSGTRAKEDLAKAAIGRNGPIAKAMDTFRFDVGRYPDSSEGLAALYEIPSGIDEDSGRWNGPYMKGTIEELLDSWQQPYEYRSPGEFNEDSYDLWSVGADSNEGTDDDLKNWRET